MVKHARAETRWTWASAGKGGGGWITVLTYVLPFVIFPVVLAVHHQPDAGRRVEGHVPSASPRAESGCRSTRRRSPSATSPAWEEAVEGAPRDQGVPRETRRSSRRSVRRIPKGRIAIRPAGHRQRPLPCARQSRGEAGGPRSSRSPAPTSSRCFVGRRAPRASATSSSRPSRNSPWQSSSWTRSTPSGPAPRARVLGGGHDEREADAEPAARRDGRLRDEGTTSS